MTKISSSILVGLVCLSFLASCTFPSDGPQGKSGRGNPPSQSGAFMRSGSGGELPTRGPRDSRDSPVQTAPISIPDSSSTSTIDTQTSSTDLSSSSQTSTTPVTTKKTVSYLSPSRRGSTTTEFSVTTQGGLITAASATYQSGDHDDQKYQRTFSQKINAAVIGKKTSEVNLDVIGGASLTTDAFEQFVRAL